MGNVCCSDRRILNINNAIDATLKYDANILVNQYDKKKIIKILHNNDVNVFLLEDNIVKKQYNLTKDAKKFDNEVETYRRLKHLPFILKPLHISKDSIYLPFISQKPIKNEQNKKIVSNYLDILENNFGIYRTAEYQWSNLLQCPRTKQVYLISFGNIPWLYKSANTKWVISDNFSYKSRRSISI